MSTRVSRGEAFIGGRCVASVELEEEWIEKVVPVPIAGQSTLGHRDLSHAGQAYLRITAVYDTEFGARLERLVEFASADLDRKRAIRDAGERAVAVNLVVDETRNLPGTSIEPPFFGYTGVADTAFPVSLPR
jgi:hypothetical protein